MEESSQDPVVSWIGGQVKQDVPLTPNLVIPILETHAGGLFPGRLSFFGLPSVLYLPG